MKLPVLALGAAILAMTMPAQNNQNNAYAFNMKSIEGKPVALSEFRGKVALFVNVASRCGYTPQYEGLEALYKKYQSKGLVILGFPANNFGAQEPGTNQEIAQFCQRTYGVTFPMFAKISVKGADQAPLYEYLTSPGANGKTAGDVRWNFTKFLVGKDGSVIARFESSVAPDSAELIAAIEAALR